MAKTIVPCKFLFGQEKITPNLLREIIPLAGNHWEELKHYEDIPLDPDFGKYAMFQMANVIKVFTCRTSSGKELAGYAVFFVMPHRHHSRVLHANADAVFLHPEFRFGDIGRKFLQYCEDRLSAMGVELIYHHVSTKRDFSLLLKRMGYDELELTMTKRIKNG